MPPILSPADWQHRTDAALDWLRRSIAATGGQGSAHSWSPLTGWTAAYPETTGYLLPTLFDYAAIKQDSGLSQLAFDCARWLTTVQLPSGAFPAGKVGTRIQPSVFNTSQILFGLSKTVKEISAEDYNAFQSALHASLVSSATWLMQVLEPDSVWRQAAYVPGYVPSYYTRAVWGLLQANEVLQQADIQEKMRRALHYYAQRFRPNGTVRDWGFQPGRPAFTHTIAYTLEGFLECACLLGEGGILDRTVAAAEALWTVRQANGRTAGRYDEDWRGDYSFICVTGNAQLSVLFSRLSEVTGEQHFAEQAAVFLAEIAAAQNLDRRSPAYGGLSGSKPSWGPYLRWRYPNWGVKFFLDAVRSADF